MIKFDYATSFILCFGKVYFQITFHFQLRPNWSSISNELSL